MAMASSKPKPVAAKAVKRPEAYFPDMCVICCHKSDLFCVGDCDHPVCFECGTRMRVLCQSNECPICRADVQQLNVVHFRPGCSSLFNDIVAKNSHYFITNTIGKRYGFRFQDREAANAVLDLLAHVCTSCKDEIEFENFELMSKHMRREHELFHCELCVEHLKLFSWERKFYTRADLARHKRTGDSNDKSHKGHPLCVFCDQRFLDKDFLFSHLRRDHYFCHFCDTDGRNSFFNDIAQLKDHLRSGHFLCEIGKCRDEELGISFRHDVDFKAHKATVHSRDMQKGELKKEMQVDVSFNYGPATMREKLVQQQRDFRTRQPFNQNGGGETSRKPQQLKKPAPNQGNSQPAATSFDLRAAMEMEKNPPLRNPSSFQVSCDEFPSLSGQSRSSNAEAAGASAASKSLASVVHREYIPRVNSAQSSLAAQKMMNDDFPALGRSAGRRKRNSTCNSSANDEAKNAQSSLSSSNYKPKFSLIDDDEVAHRKKKEPEVLMETKADDVAVKTTPTATPPADVAWGQPRIVGMSQNEFPELPSLANPVKNATKMGKNASASKKLYASSASSTLQKATAKKIDNNNLNMKSISESLQLETLPKQKIQQRHAKPIPKPKEQVAQSFNEDLATQSFTKNFLKQVQESLDDKKTSPIQNGSITSPPGLTKSSISENMSNWAPPGLTKSVSDSIPPGFTSVSDRNENHLYNQYTKPKNFDARNRILMDRLQSELDKSQLSEFKSASHNFRRQNGPAALYYEKIWEILHESLFLAIFQELMCLLPDIRLQNELYECHRGTLQPGVKKCDLCRQVLDLNDFNDHTASHLKPTQNLAEEFPALA